MNIYCGILCLMLGGIKVQSQNYISNLSFKQEQNYIVVNYNLATISTDQYYKVQIRVESSIKGTLDAYEFNGHIGKVETGGSKQIHWNVLKDMNKLKGGIEISLSATLYDRVEEEGYADAKAYYRRGEYKKAKPIFERLAYEGNVAAQCYLGYMYEKGKGVGESDEEAVKWYRKSAEQGYARGQCNLGYMHEFGKGVKQSNEEAVKWYRKSAEQGYARGQCNLGIMHEFGKGVKQSNEEAVKWYRKSAEQGYALGQNSLGTMYYHGKGVEQSYEKAVKWYRKSAEQEYAIGQYNLGLMYEFGKGVAQSNEDAIKWYKKSAAQGYEAAKESLKVLGYEP